LPQLFTILYTRNILSVIIEGGKQVLETCIKENLWDEARVFTGQKYFKYGLPAPSIKKEPVNTEFIGGDELNIYINA